MQKEVFKTHPAPELDLLFEAFFMKKYEGTPLGAPVRKQNVRFFSKALLISKNEAKNVNLYYLRLDNRFLLSN
jgi:hypothetical protein